MGLDSHAVSIDRSQRPGALKLINGIGNIMHRLFPVSPLNVDSLVSSAKKNSGIRGDVQADFLDPLHVLVDAINNTAGLDVSGQILTRQTLTAALGNQLHIQDILASHPQIETEQLDRPLFVIGFPRTGTTFIHNLLALDENGRAPKMWQVIKPDLVSSLSDKEQTRRIKQAEKFVKFAYYLVPQLKAVHELYPDGADECLKLIENTFISPHFCLYFNIPEYWDWLLASESDYFVRVYEYHKKQLQILQHGAPEKHWVLKTPVHLFFLDALLKVYPDARVVHMQRDPMECIPSFCSLIGVNRALFADHVDMKEIGKFGLQFYAECNKRASDAIATANSGSIISVQYRDFVNDPKATVRQIYDYFGMEHPETHGKLIDQWLHDHPKNKHGMHKYTLEQFGLTQQDIQNSLATDT
jgi:hypothetical protein